ncbi:MAG: pyrroline-5-carboxylate reductase dimerization domain-containing protein, partial [Pseudomonadota bacterium]
NMAGAMLAGWLAAGVDSSRFVVVDPALQHAPDGVDLHRAIPNKSDHDAVLLGVKPQQLDALTDELQAITGPGVTIYSLLAGVTLDGLVDAFPEARAHVRVMPNLAARIRKSPVILAERGLDEAARKATFTLFDHLGSALWLESEDQFNLVTALAGSGPGFVYRFIDALAGAAVDLGLERASADRLALTMVEGAARLAGGADVSPAQLADRVASPGGMTREGLNVLDEGEALQQLLEAALEATAKKGDELAQNTVK